MADFEEPNDKSIDLRRDDVVSAETQVDASALALAAVFNVVAFPPNLPEYLKEIILNRAEQVREAEGSLAADNIMNPDDRRRKAERDADDDNLSQLANIVQQQREEREREEWARTTSTVAGVKLTGAEWAQLAERLRTDRELKDALISKFEKRGMSEADAERLYERVADTAEIAAKPPSQRTEAETERFEKAKADPAVQQGIADASKLTHLDHSQSVNPESEPTKPAPVSAQPEMRVAMASGPSF